MLIDFGVAVKVTRVWQASLRRTTRTTTEFELTSQFGHSFKFEANGHAVVMNWSPVAVRAIKFIKPQIKNS